jgi:hypothetical protein
MYGDSPMGAARAADKMQVLLPAGLVLDGAAVT